MKKLLLLILLPILTIIGLSRIANAQTGNAEGNGFRVSPTRTDLVVEKGQSRTFTVSLENITSSPITARAIINDFLANPNEQGGASIVLDETAAPLKSSLRSYMQMPSDVLLDSKERKEFKFTISIPQDARAGGYYGVIRFVPITPDAGDGNVGLTASVGSLVLVEVPGEVNRKLELEEFGIARTGKGSGGRLLTSGPVTAVVRLKNSGDIHLRPYGTVNLRNSKGEEIATQELNQTDQPSNVMPDSVRRFEVAFKDPAKMFGKYTIEMSAAYEQGSGNIITAKKTFYVYPVWFLGVVLFGTLVVITLVYVVARKIRRHRR